MVFCLVLIIILAAVPAQPTRVSQPLPTPQSVSSPPPTVEEPALVIDLSGVPDGTLGKCVLSSYKNCGVISCFKLLSSFSHYRQLSPISVSDSTEYSVSMVPTWNPSWFELP